VRTQWRQFPGSLKIGIVLVATAGLALTSLQMYQTFMRAEEPLDNREHVIHTFEVIRTAQQLDRALQDAERGQRGYLLTNDRKYAAPYEEAISRIPVLEEQLRRMTADNADQQKRLFRLQHEIDTKLAEMKNTIDANDTQGFAAAKAIVTTDAGFQAMRTVTELIDEIIGAEDALLIQRMDLAAQADRQTARVSAISSVLASALMIFGAVLVVSAFRQWAHQQRALEQTRAQFAQAQKLEALGQLTGGIAHDFNNLLQSITGGLSILRQRLPDLEPETATWIDVIKRSADRAAKLTQRLLAFSRRQPLNPTPLDFNRVMQGMMVILQKTIGEAYALETVTAAGLWTVQADANELETTILNLVLNARDAMPAGGKLTIETGNVFLDDAYGRREGLNPGQYVLLAVSDGGIGMTQETIQQAFEPFFTTKEHGRGTGLGLSQVHGFIKQSGGHVKIYSEIGEGTTVKIYLPRYIDANAPSSVESPPVETPLRARGETILLVEDDADVRHFVATILIQQGFRVLTAADADTALRQLRLDTSVTLLLTDVGLPGGKNGRKLADEALGLNPSIKVLFMTGYAKNAIIHHGRLDPGVHLLVKPFTEQDLSRKLDEVLRSSTGFVPDDRMPNDKTAAPRTPSE
jgi:signal transduction histidine kinase/ActR/RegA family two-component response regulator